MARNDLSFFFALCGSLLAHALVLGTAAELYQFQSPRGRTVLVRIFKPQPTPPPSVEEDPEELDPMQRIGAAEGGGISIMESPGELPQLAPKAMQEQPFVSRDPIGPGKIGDDPTDSVMPLGEAAAPAPSPSPQQLAFAAAQPESQPYLGETQIAGDFAAPFKPTPPAPKPSPPAPPVASAAPPSPPSPPSNAKPGSSSSADPAPMSDSEIDPVSTIGGVDFRSGSTKVRLGRKTKLTRPHLSLAAQADLMTTRFAAVVLRIRIDATGKVLSAEIARSSGNPAIDQPCKLAAYNWWFEPITDKNGQPTNDVIMFSIRFI